MGLCRFHDGDPQGPALRMQRIAANGRYEYEAAKIESLSTSCMLHGGRYLEGGTNG